MSNQEFIPYQEAEPTRPDFTVTRISEGLGFGEGSISAVERQAQTEGLDELTDEVLRSPDILTPVSQDQGERITDDGCGDGRRVGVVFSRTSNEEGVTDAIYKTSLMRPKVFGGGLAMATASLVAAGRVEGRTAEESFADARKAADESGLDYGAHVAIDTHGDSATGCGALDKAPQIMAAVSTYRDHIKQTIEALVGPAPELDNGNDGQPGGGVLDAFERASQAEDGTYRSRAVMDGIIEDGKVVKALDDDHMETRICLNDVPGYTVDQGLVRTATDGEAQVFSVDVWRMREIAATMSGSPDEERRMFLGQLTYTLATAAILTRGDLPVVAYAPAETQPVE